LPGAAAARVLDRSKGCRLNAMAKGFEVFVVIDRSNLRACLWSILYCLLIAVGCGAMVEQGVSYFVVVPVGLFVFPLLASLPFLLWLKSAGRRETG